MTDRLLDAITRRRLRDPVLASDGETYSLAALQTAMHHDPLHRSPVTGEVLRVTAYRNRVISTLLGERPCGAEAVALWHSDAPAVPDTVVRCMYHLPARPSADAATFFLTVGLDAEVGPDFSGVVVEVWAVRDVGPAALLRLVHPPPPEEFWDTAVELATFVAGPTAFSNPWCFAGASVTVRGRAMGTLETLWLQARGTPRGGPRVGGVAGGL